MATRSRAVPKLAIVSEPTEEGTDLSVVMLSMGFAHPAVPITGSVALTLAAREPGTVLADVVGPRTGDGLAMRTAAGVVSTFISESEDAGSDLTERITEAYKVDPAVREHVVALLKDSYNVSVE
ncbi:PrpF domain-containing protein [Actinomycetota bacterium]